MAPFRVRVSASKFREPDVAFVLQEYRKAIRIIVSIIAFGALAVQTGCNYLEAERNVGAGKLGEYWVRVSFAGSLFVRW